MIMNTISNFLTESLLNPKAVKPEAIAGRPYSGAVGFIEGKGFNGGVIVGQPFAFDDSSAQKEAAALASKDFTMKVDFDGLISAIEKNKKGAYDVVLKGDKYKRMMYVYFVPNKNNEIHCCLYSDTNVYLKGNYAYAMKM